MAFGIKKKKQKRKWMINNTDFHFMDLDYIFYFANG